MALLTRTRLVAIVVLLAASVAPARAQVVVGVTETFDFDRPESWGMKYYTSLVLLTSMGVPERKAKGQVDLGFEGGYVPQLSDAERRLGFNGTSLQDVNHTSVFGRIRGSVGLGQGLALELGYTPPIELGGAKPHFFALALGRPFALSDAWRLGVRGYGQIGKIEGAITCSPEEVAAGYDTQLNPFQCSEPSKDVSYQNALGLELVAGFDGRSRFKPYAGLSVNYMDLEFDINAVYTDGLVEDHSVQLTSGTTLSAMAGLTYAAGARWRVTAELFYSWLSIVRPPSTSSANEGFLNGRVFVSYRVH
jgi:opacity protein-like surface antigen